VQRDNATLRQVPASLTVLPRVQCVHPRVLGRGPGSLMSKQQGPPQALTTVGGAVHRRPSAPTRNIQDPIRGQASRLQRMERGAHAAILPLSNCLNLINK
jgi:hypothetical protein